MEAIRLRQEEADMSHYENMPMQYTEIFLALKIFDIFLIFAQNIDCGYKLESPKSMFWSKNKKNRYTPAYPSFTI